MSEPSKPVGAIFDAALELPPERRAAYLHEACGGDDSLRQRVEALLRAHESVEAFMDHPVVELRRETVVGKPPEQPGDRIGRYKLLQQIGEGGCGVVYMAEQEEPVRRRVALKVIKLGMDTKSVIARFEAERQALALMDHPNIAKVLDAGATDTGRPYFVMELVRGVKITDYCDQNNLSTQERLDLFIQVCRAIQHAHQKGIIHRDIKPSNVLVTMSDGVPVPKVIDFGIAKATQGKLTDQTLFTAFEQLIGTPAYMSPEQAELSVHDIDTRSDIYSLGVLLYELLTGQTPFDAKKLLQAGLDEIRRTVREQEPARPSTRLSTMLGADLREMAKRRNVEAPKLIHLVRGDLDWIVMKALEKDRARRYDTVNGLAMDITRHLNCEPVLARPPSRLYEFQKTLRRHSFGFAAAGAVMGVLLIGTTVSTWLYLQEKQARQLADAEARKNQQLAQSFRNALDIAHPNPQAGDLPQVRKVLDEVVANLPLDFPNQPEVAMVLRTSLISDYENLELWPQAAELASQNVQVARAHFSPNDAAIAVAFAQLGRDQWQAGWHAVAEASLRQALAGNGKRLWPGDLRHTQGALANLVEILLPLRQPTVDEQLLHQLLTPAVEQYPNEAGVVAIRGDFFARRAQWKAAAADLARAVELDPANPLYYHALAPLLAAESDVQNYRQLCSRILAGFRDATNPATADRMAKDCLIVPSSGVDLTLVDRMADTAATGGHPYGLFCKGLAQYRLGRFGSAAEWMNEVLTHPNRNPIRDVEAYMVLAMAQHRSKQADEANAALARGVDIAESKLPKLDSGDLGDGWIDWIIAHALMREAKALIEGHADLLSNQTKGK